jgi:hypothetical protein
VAAVAPSRVGLVRRRADEAGVALRSVGRTGGGRLAIGRVIDVGLDALATRWRDELPVAFGEASTP